MAKPVRPIPEGYHTVTPYLSVDGAASAIEFYKKAFDAIEVMRMEQPDGRIGHADIRIGDSHIMLSDEAPELDFLSPRKTHGTPVHLALYVEDVDRFVARAVSAGAKVTRPVENKFYGDRGGSLVDPFGHAWHVATHVEDVAPEEMRRRAEALATQA